MWSSNGISFLFIVTAKSFFPIYPLIVRASTAGGNIIWWSCGCCNWDCKETRECWETHCRMFTICMHYIWFMAHSNNLHVLFIHLLISVFPTLFSHLRFQSWLDLPTQKFCMLNLCRLFSLALERGTSLPCCLNQWGKRRKAWLSRPELSLNLISLLENCLVFFFFFENIVRKHKCASQLRIVLWWFPNASATANNVIRWIPLFYCFLEFQNAQRHCFPLQPVHLWMWIHIDHLVTSPNKY